MPEYHLPHGDTAIVFGDLSAFVQGYIEAAFFTDAQDGDDCGEGSFDELAPEALDQAIADCEAFQARAADLLARAYSSDKCDYDEADAGRDFWFTRNGHGVGYWDRYALSDGLGDALSDLGRHDEVTLYRGDDGLLYFA